jgi:beta-lactamase regulating signal transducer with metallopeptidase domain
VSRLEAFAGQWIRWSAAMAWQVAVVVVIVALLDRLLRRRSPSLRHALWGLVLVKLLLPPSLASPFGWRAQETPGAAGDGALAMPGWVLPLFLAWVVLVTCLAAARGIARRRLRAQWLADARLATGPAGDLIASAARRVGLARTPALWFAPAAPGPLTMGLRRPVVLLPTSWLEGMRPADLEHVLLHECAHVRRGDLWLAAAWTCVRVFYAWHPLVAWAARRAHGVREACCDATVTAALAGSAEAYGETLRRMARRALGDPAPSGAAAFLGGRDGLAERLRALERPRPPRPWSACALALALGLLLVPLAAASVALTPAERERREADAALARLLPHEPGSGCTPLRFAVMRAAAASSR